MSEYKAQPGDLASITLSNGHVHPVAWWRLGSGWITPTVTVHPVHVVAARPLVVIDPEDREQVERFWAIFSGLNTHHLGLTGALQAALREFANPTPPRPDEPTGLGAVVEDAEGNLWIRRGPTHYIAAEGSSSGFYNNAQTWGELSAVRVLSPGVTDE